MLYLKLVDKDLPEVFYIFLSFKSLGWYDYKKVSYGQKYTLKKVSYGHSRLYFFD